jgi:hypothetical protein
MSLKVILSVTFLASLFSGVSPAQTLQDPWEESYANLDATGPHVLVCWKFDEMPLSDASGHGTQLYLKAATPQPEGRFGGALTFRTLAGKGRYVALTQPSIARLSPSGAFSAEMWVRANEHIQSTEHSYLMDKQGESLNDYRWTLMAADARGLRRMAVSLGFGTEVREFLSDPVLIAPGQWRHLAFTYDAAGSVSFFVDSESAGSAFQKDCGPVQAGAQPLCLGGGVKFSASFPGDIDEVRLCDGLRGFSPFSLVLTGQRRVWQRQEQSSSWRVICTNLRPTPLIGAGMTYTVGGATQSFILPDLEPGGKYETDFAPDTALKPGTYQIEASVHSGNLRISKSKEFQIVPRPSAHLPFIMQGAAVSDLPELQSLACTHWVGLTNEDSHYLGAKERDHHLDTLPWLDACLAAGLRTIVALEPWRATLPKTSFHRMNREGVAHQPPDLNVTSRGVLGLTANCSRRFMSNYRENKIWAGTWLNSAPLSQAQPGFSKDEQAAYLKFSSREIPLQVQRGGGVDWRTLPDFPADRVIPDDHPILSYYRWFWSEGSGWRAVQESWLQGLDRERGERQDVWSMMDPAVRQPSIGGTSSPMNDIADQTTDARDPMLTGLCLDQLLAMRQANAREQGVFGILPLSWERSSVAPPGAEGTAESILMAELSSPVQRVTLSPSILKETLWTMLSRPVKGLVCTGWPALRPVSESGSTDRSTHPHARTVFRDFADRILRPLGPMLARRQQSRTPVAMLESFTSQMFAGRGLYREGSPRTLAVWQALQRAHIQADILFEETLAAGGLDGRDILILSECDVLPAGLVEKIKEWQQGGGKIIADEHLCPALKADALLSEAPVQPSPASQPGAPAASIATETADPAPVTPPPAPAPDTLPLPEKLTQLCKDLGWQPRITCDSPDVILHATRTGEATCLFVINNSREAGTYVGQHGLVMENGLPVSASLNLGSDSINVYDLTRSAFVLPKREDSGLTIPLKLGPAEGRIFLLSSAPLLELNLDLPQTATCGSTAEARITMATSGGRPMPAAIPVAIRIRDADGAPAEWDGYHVVEDGLLTLHLDLARNETPGTWEVHVRELASGIETVKWMKVQKE